MSLVTPPVLVCFSCQRLSLFFFTTIDSACLTPRRLTTRWGRAVFIIFCSMQCFRYSRLTTRSFFASLCDGYRTRTASYLGCIEVFLPPLFLCCFSFLSTTSASASSLVSFRLPNRGHPFFFLFICVCTSRFLRRYSVSLPLGARPSCCILTTAGAALP